MQRHKKIYDHNLEKNSQQKQTVKDPDMGIHKQGLKNILCDYVQFKRKYGYNKQMGNLSGEMESIKRKTNEIIEQRSTNFTEWV